MLVDTSNRDVCVILENVQFAFICAAFICIGLILFLFSLYPCPFMFILSALSGFNYI